VSQQDVISTRIERICLVQWCSSAGCTFNPLGVREPLWLHLWVPTNHACRCHRT